MTVVFAILLTGVSGLLAFSSVKSGVMLDRFGRIAARREHSPVIFWTLWIPIALLAVGGSAFLAWILYVELVG